MEDLQRRKHQRKKVVFKAFTEALRLQKNIHTDSCRLSANFVNYANLLFILGWRLYFYANENKEPIHIHAEKGDMECKYWIMIDELDIREEFTYNMSPKDKREVRKIIFNNFEIIVDSWNKFFNGII